jgi:hypothetical protein
MTLIIYFITVNTVNPMYVSADEVKSGTSANNETKKDDVYAMVDKKPKKANVGKLKVSISQRLFVGVGGQQIV